jgi:cytochrome c1
MLKLALTIARGLSLMLAFAFVCSSGPSARAQESAIAGDPKRGAALIQRYGCGACHTIPGITGANGLVGPPLTMMGRRIYIAGVLRNTPDNMMRWIRDPQKIVPGNAMPEMGITEAEARDLAAFLETLR